MKTSVCRSVLFWVGTLIAGIVVVLTLGNSRVAALFRSLLAKVRPPEPLPPKPTPRMRVDIVSPADMEISDVKATVDAMDDDALAADINERYGSDTKP